MTDPEFRPVGPDEHESFARITDYAFHPTDGPREYDESPERIADRYGVFDDDELVSVCGHYDFTARLRGGWVPLAGLAAVATPPEHRREGHVRRLVRASLRRWRGTAPLAALWPFGRAYYAQFGWATANEAVSYSLPPEQLAFARGAATGRARPVSVEEWESAQAVHEAFAADRTLALRRADEAWWRERVFHADEDDRPYAYGWERDGDLRGFATYTVEDAGEGVDDRRLSVDDLAYADYDALLGLLGFFADHDSQVSAVSFTTEARTDLLDLVADPSAVEAAVRSGPMVRVVDVEDALSTVPYPDDATAALTVAVTDEMAPWNDDVLELRVRDGVGECERSDTPADDAEVTVDVGTLSQLVVGYHDVETARRVGDLSVDGGSDGSDGATGELVETLAALFPPETVFLRTFF